MAIKHRSFIQQVKTPQNPKDMFYVNQENLYKNYLMLILLGLFMILYMWIY